MVKPRWLFLSLLMMPLPFSAIAGNLSKSEKQWLKMVDFIITSEERKIFRKKLRDPFEREKFVKLFWARRDPDPEDAANPFRDEYLARYDYVLTHFESGNQKIPRDDRSYIYMLLGKPEKIEPRVDVIIMGPRWRNRYLQHQPELWIYKDPGFDYKKTKLKIQMIPTSTFGDYVAVTDNFSNNWIRRLKFKFILHPDMETPPINVTDAKNFQDVVDATSPPSRSPTTGSDGRSDSNQAVASPTRADEPARETRLSVPARPDSGLEGSETYSFRSDADNPLNLNAAWAHFTRGDENGLLLARFGFPLTNIDFTFEKSQYRAPFTLTYQVFDSSGIPILGDQLETVVSVPSREAIEDKTTFYTKDIAALLRSGRYRLKIQIELPGKAPSYFENELEIPSLDGKVLSATRLALMDPHVHPDSAKFNIRDKPFAPMLAEEISRGQPLYPVLELTAIPDEDTLDTMQIHAIRNGEIVKTWVLYHEERTITTHETVLVHPVLRTQTLEPGSYRLRFEMEMPSGTLLLSECTLSITE